MQQPHCSGRRPAPGAHPLYSFEAEEQLSVKVRWQVKGSSYRSNWNFWTRSTNTACYREEPRVKGQYRRTHRRSYAFTLRARDDSIHDMRPAIRDVIQQVGLEALHGQGCRDWEGRGSHGTIVRWDCLRQWNGLHETLKVLMPTKIKGGSVSARANRRRKWARSCDVWAMASKSNSAVLLQRKIESYPISSKHTKVSFCGKRSGG